MKRSIIFLFTLALLVSACNSKFLEIFPETELSSPVFFKTEADFQQAVNATYVPLRDIVNSRAWLLGEMHSDNTYYARNPLFGATEQQEDIADFAIPTADGLTTNTHVLNQYRLDYDIIARANQVLVLIDDVDFDATSKANLKGQAQFLRAYAYFELVRYFGRAPLHLTPVANRQEAAAELANTEQLYAQIEKDALAATTGLFAKSKQEPGRVTSGSAKTLLANVYIQQKKWAQAEPLLRDVITSGEYSLMPNYVDAFSTSTGNKNNKESVFEVQFLEGSAGLNGNFLYSFMPRPMTPEELKPITGTSNPQPLSGEGNNIPTPDIIAAYEPGDTRKDVSIGYVTLSGSLRKNKVYPYIKKYAKPHALNGNHGMNWPIYRYSEVLLFMAEALNEQGKTGEAATYLNQVRKRAGLADTKAASQAAMRDAIFQERRVELAFENKRWFDLLRSGKAVETITAYGQRIKANPEAYYYPVSEGSLPRSNAFTQIDLLYPLPADESSLTPYF
ncbi:RagB/SusD family nutrient uptake outer membrane protein [Persicitalea jodogahamensis]|uniref:Membrane protein n=1 Tax=Persicitalea jodogahamensis TaxID=402147 RepID=A0A8J3D5V6_9BACT|nr:RagB/SusD family nutrient uptake outer membrane protein [Persicitalea jodogahamensis]GHB57270.1 membrane protein [Persicitalea jodogahamensis]